jgi:hypothetical protein
VRWDVPRRGDIPPMMHLRGRGRGRTRGGGQLNGFGRTALTAFGNKVVEPPSYSPRSTRSRASKRSQPGGDTHSTGHRELLALQPSQRVSCGGAPKASGIKKRKRQGRDLKYV